MVTRGIVLRSNPRFGDEPLAGKGIRYALKQPSNRRPGC